MENLNQLFVKLKYLKKIKSKFYEEKLIQDCIHSLPSAIKQNNYKQIIDILSFNSKMLTFLLRILKNKNQPTIISILHHLLSATLLNFDGGRI